MKQHNTSPHTHIILSKRARQEIYQDIHQRTSIEACGVLLGSMGREGNWHVERVQPLANTANSPVYFEFAPEELLTTEMHNEGQVIGVYHSHPTGFPQASNTDQQNMHRVNVEQGIPWAWLIVCGPFNATSDFSHDSDLAPGKLLAYYHYEHEGLQRLDIVYQD
ncbi:Mov34/MPN/PAD-1 family protein [Ktedonospora formicarum]|uniref:MPN domain-containing protein n=1 Tax=Ktedonospora formicarum TaxID=2778364 RepID=A0A8J3MQC5_9CHLR|nr:Mov34/MPN/PAD-1 family protein [Ktedonospora formicarum]GHO42478.1 hypothetical protein KSX_06410 [Ktedonospora formicarum]